MPSRSLISSAVSVSILSSLRSPLVHPRPDLSDLRVDFFERIAQNNQKLMDAGIEKVEGNSDIIKTLTSSVAEFPLYFNIIEP